MTSSDFSATLASTAFIDSASEAIGGFVAEHAGAGSDRDRAIRLYLAVRDTIRYDPYSFRLEPARYAASDCISAGAAFCVPKAILLAAASRAIGIPARLGFANVRNHLTSPRLAALMGSDLFRWHGYTSLYIDGKWVKATPAFNLALCQRFGVAPLEFDGREDSVFQPFDQSGRRHMEYVDIIGEFDDFPYERFAADMKLYYPALLATHDGVVGQDKAEGAVVDKDFA